MSRTTMLDDEEWKRFMCRRELHRFFDVVVGQINQRQRSLEEAKDIIHELKNFHTLVTHIPGIATQTKTCFSDFVNSSSQMISLSINSTDDIDIDNELKLLALEKKLFLSLFNSPSKRIREKFWNYLAIQLGKTQMDPIKIFQIDREIVDRFFNILTNFIRQYPNTTVRVWDGDEIKIEFETGRNGVYFNVSMEDFVEVLGTIEKENKKVKVIVKLSQIISSQELELAIQELTGEKPRSTEIFEVVRGEKWGAHTLMTKSALHKLKEIDELYITIGNQKYEYCPNPEETDPEEEEFESF